MQQRCLGTIHGCYCDLYQPLGLSTSAIRTRSARVAPPFSASPPRDGFHRDLAYPQIAGHLLFICLPSPAASPAIRGERAFRTVAASAKHRPRPSPPSIAFDRSHHGIEHILSWNGLERKSTAPRSWRERTSKYRHTRSSSRPAAEPPFGQLSLEVQAVHSASGCR